MCRMKEEFAGFEDKPKAVCLIVRLDQPHSRVLEIAQGTF